MIPLAVVLPLVEQLLKIGATLVEHAEAQGAAEGATLQELQIRLNVTAASVASYRHGTIGINRGTTSQGGLGEVTHVEPESVAAGLAAATAVAQAEEPGVQPPQRSQ